MFVDHVPPLTVMCWATVVKLRFGAVPNTSRTRRSVLSVPVPLNATVPLPAAQPAVAVVSAGAGVGALPGQAARRRLSAGRMSDIDAEVDEEVRLVTCARAKYVHAADPRALATALRSTAASP